VSGSVGERRLHFTRTLPLIGTTEPSIAAEAPGAILTARLAAEKLTGLAEPSERTRFARELERSALRIAGLRRIARDPGTDQREPPASDPWSPHRAIVQWARAGDRAEATWLAFLTTFFGPDERPGRELWRATRVFYSGFGEGRVSWRAVSKNLDAFNRLCRRHGDLYATLARGNHRKNEPRKDIEHWRGILGAVPRLVELARRHSGLSRWFHGNDDSASMRFERLMQEFDVVSFGRTGRFDLLVLLGDLDDYPLSAPRLYLEGATGPKAGARRVLPERRTLRALDDELTAVAGRIGVEVQAMEDALCNWQKR
jgi:hypothetical protein